MHHKMLQNAFSKKHDDILLRKEGGRRVVALLSLPFCP